MLNFTKSFLLLFVLMMGSIAHADPQTTTPNPNQTPVVMDIDCSPAFSKDGAVLVENSTLCSQDVGLNALALSISSVIKGNSALQSVFHSLDVSIPRYAETATFISRPIGAVASAAVNICLIIVGFAAMYRIYIFGYKGMRDSSIEQAIRDPNTYKAFAAFAVVAFLSVKIGDINIAQILVVASGVIALKITTFLFSSMIAVFDFDADSNIAVEAYQEFLPQGEVYATNIMHGLYGAQEAALRSNFTNVLSENASMLPPEGANLGGVDSILSWLGFAIYEEKNPTFREYFSGIFDDSHLRIQQSSGVVRVPSFSGNHSSGSQVMASGSSSLSVVDGRYNFEQKKQVSELFSKTYEYLELFKNTNTLDIVSPMPTALDENIVIKIASSGIIDSIGGLMISSGAGEVINDSAIIAQEGDKLLSLLNAIRSENPMISPTDIISVVQAMALGSISTSAIKSGKLSSSFMFNPFVGADLFLSQSPKEPIHKILAESLRGVRELRSYHCINNFSGTAEEMILLSSVDEKGESYWDEEAKGVGDIFPKCILPSNGDINKYVSIAPVKMTEEAIKIVKTIRDSDTNDLTGNVTTMLLAQSDVAKNMNVYSNIGSGLSAGTDASAALEKAQVHMRNIASYYARVAAIGRYAALKSIDSVNEEEKQGFLKNLRQQGAVAVSSYFMQLSREQEKYTDVIFNASPKVTSKVNLREGGNTPHQLAVWANDEILIAKKQFLPRSEMTFARNLMAKNVDMAASSMTGDEPSESDTAIVTKIVMAIADIMIPAEEILTKGFGLESDNIIEGLSACTTTSNCVNFKQHPLATVSIFGKDMLVVGLTIIIVDKLVRLIDGIANNSDDDGGIFSFVTSFIKNIAVGWVTKFIKVLAIFTSILSIFGSAYVFAGIFVGYIVPMMPYIAQIMMWLGWFAEFLILFSVIPLLVAYAFIVKDDGEALFRPSSIISMLASLILRAPLIFISFMVFYTLSYGGIYIVNSTLYTMFKLEIASGSIMGMIMSIFGSVVFFVFTVGMYFLIFKSLTKMMTEMPDYVLRPMGIESLNVQVSSGIEAFIAARTIQQLTEKAMVAPLDMIAANQSTQEPPAGREQSKSGNESPVTDQKPVGNESPVTDQKPVGNESPVTDQKPATNQKPAANEKPVRNKRQTAEQNKPTASNTSNQSGKSTEDNDVGHDDNS